LIPLETHEVASAPKCLTDDPERMEHQRRLIKNPEGRRVVDFRAVTYTSSTTAGR
jgi:hypothetical protein